MQSPGKNVMMIVCALKGDDPTHRSKENIPISEHKVYRLARYFRECEHPIKSFRLSL
jgi:hypothetical protein